MYRIIEHTADVGIEVKTSNLSKAFNEISQGFTEIVTGGNLPDKNEIRKISIESSELDSLLVRYISQLIYLFDTEAFLVSLSKLKIRKRLIYTLTGNVSGDIYDEVKHGYGVEVKAVSYHMLEVQEGPPSKIRVILDL